MVGGACGKQNATLMLERPIQVNLQVNFKYSISYLMVFCRGVRMEHEMFLLLFELTKLSTGFLAGMLCVSCLCLCVHLFVSFQ